MFFKGIDGFTNDNSTLTALATESGRQPEPHTYMGKKRKPGIARGRVGRTAVTATTIAQDGDHTSNSGLTETCSLAGSTLELN